MGFARRFRMGSLVALSGVLAAIALLLSWSFGSMDAHATIPAPGLNFSISAEGESGCDTTEGDATCYIDPGTEFTLSVTLDPLPSDIESYEGYDIYISYTGLTSADNASPADNWPDCGFPVTHFEAGIVAGGCSIGIDSGPSTYTGVLLANDFTCSDSGTISLVAGDGSTDLLETVSEHHAEGAGTLETLNITCGSPPTATPLPVPTKLPGTGTAGPDHDGSSGSGLWLLIGVLVAGAAGAGVIGRRLARAAR